MLQVICAVTFLGLVLSAHTAVPPCVGVLRYSQKAVELMFQTQRFPLQDLLSKSDISTDVYVETSDPQQLDIQSADVIHISAQLVPNVGVKTFINTDLLLSYKVDNIAISVRVLADVTSVVQIVQDISGNPKFSVSTCDTRIQDFQVFQETEGLDVMKKVITIALNHKLCLISTSVFLGINVQLGEFAGLIQLGNQLQIRHSLSSSPTVTDHHLELGVNAEFYLLGHGLHMPVPTACPVLLPVQTSDAIPMFSLFVQQDRFNEVISAMEWAGAFNLDITGKTAEGINQLTTEALTLVSPDIPKLYTQNYPVILKVGTNKTPRVTLHKGKIVLYLQPTVELMVILPQERHYDSMMVLHTDLQMDVHMTVKENKLKTESVTYSRNLTLSLDSSAVSSVKMNILRGVIAPYVEQALLFHYKAALGVGWTLPNLLHLQITDPTIDIYEGYAVISGNLEIPV